MKLRLAVGLLVVWVASAHAAPPRSTAAVIQLAMWANRTHNDDACVVKLDGTVACWGGNNDGRLALYDQGAFRNTAIPIAGVSDATQVALGPRHGCALLRSGSITCWGTTENGESGTIATTNITEPMQVVWP